MQLYIKQKVFSWADRFSVKDADGRDRYFAEGELFSWGHKLHIYDENGLERAFIKQKVLTFLPKFEVYVGDTLAVEVEKELTFFKPKYALSGPGWTVDGEFLSHDYTISDGAGGFVASIAKAWLSWGDSYEVTIADGVDEVLVVATVLAIDCVLAAQDAAASSGAN